MRRFQCGFGRLSAALVVALLPAPAHAQAWIGEFSTDYSRLTASAKLRRDCAAGIPAPQKQAAKVIAAAEKQVAAYAALVPSADAKALNAVFVLPEYKPRWRDEAGEVPVAQLGQRLPPAGAVIERIDISVGVDARSARGLWRIGTADGASRVVAADIVHGPVSLLGNGWRILRLAEWGAGEPLPTLHRYCWLDREAWNWDAPPAPVVAEKSTPLPP